MPNQTIYEKMSRQRLEIAAAQIDILDYFDSKNKERRTQELYDVSHKSIMTEQSEHSLEKMDELIRKYQEEIIAFRKENPDVEKSRKVRKKMKELERLCGSCGF